MSKNKYVGLVVVIVVLAGAAGGYFWHAQVAHKKLLNSTNSDKQILGSETTSNSIPLNGDYQNKQDTGGLSVNTSTGSDGLGQLTPNSGGQDNSSGSNSKSQPSPFDPSTFAQYEKYKDGNSGLFADVLKGDGVELAEGKKVAVYYRGWLTNGQLFDESKKDDKGELQPFVFTPGAHEVIPGWEQAVIGMKVGGVRLVIVPPAAGYGEKGQGPIPPNAVLIFQIQLAAVE